MLLYNARYKQFLYIFGFDCHWQWHWLAKNSPVRIFMALHLELLQHPTSDIHFHSTLILHCCTLRIRDMRWTCCRSYFVIAQFDWGCHSFGVSQCRYNVAK